MTVSEHAQRFRAPLRRLGKGVLLRAPFIGGPLGERAELTQTRDHLQQERDQLRRERDGLEQQRDGMERERKQLVEERDQLVEERSQLQLVGRPSERDRSLYPFPLEHQPRLAYHGNLHPYLATFANDKSSRVLEIGSREVSSCSVWKESMPNCDYVGFDVLPGTNVDVVGDAHRLSEYFEPESFDAVISLAVFEHLAMPWLVAEEISKVLKPGGLVLIETHFSYGEHEVPWHFFQFNQRALECLFNPGLGYEVVDSGMDNPMVGRFAIDASPYLVGAPIPNLYCHSSIIARKTASPSRAIGTDPWRASYPEFIAGSMYPRNTGLSAKQHASPDER